MAQLRRSDGLTILELIVNLTIIAVLAAIAYPSFMIFQARARTATAQSDLRSIQLALEQLANDTGQWPGPTEVSHVGSGAVWDLNSAEAGLVKADGLFPNWQGPYLNAVPKDPWGSDYFLDANYNIGGTTYAAIGSFGPNGCCQNTHDADNVIIKLTEGSVEPAPIPGPTEPSNGSSSSDTKGKGKSTKGK